MDWYGILDAISIIYANLNMIVAWMAGLWVWIKKRKTTVIQPLQISAKQCETKPGIGKEYFCEIHVANLPNESEGIRAFLTNWIPAPSEQIQYNLSHTERIPQSTDFPILLPEIEADPKQPDIHRFKCFHMPQHGVGPTIEIVSQETKFLPFQTNNPIFKTTIEIKHGAMVLGIQTFQVEFVRGSGNVISYFRIQKA